MSRLATTLFVLFCVFLACLVVSMYGFLMAAEYHRLHGDAGTARTYEMVGSALFCLGPMMFYGVETAEEHKEVLRKFGKFLGAFTQKAFKFLLGAARG